MAGENVMGDKTILREANRHPLLDRDEEQDLARRAVAGDGEATRRLVGSHLRFVIKIARPYLRFGLPMSDLLQEGTLGLVQAIRRFDPSRGVRLSTYAMWWIRASIQDYAQRSWSLVRGGTGGSSRRPATADTAGNAADRSGSPIWPRSGGFVVRTADMAADMAADVAAVARRLVWAEPSYDHETGETESPLDHLASDAPTPEQWLTAVSQQRFVRNALAAALEGLPPRERFVIRKRYLEDVRPTFAAIGRELGLSKDRVRQLEAKALHRLREMLGPVAADLTLGNN